MYASQEQASGDQPSLGAQAPFDEGGATGRLPRWAGDMDLPGMDDDGMPD
jgi:hypothetical protein